MDNNYYRECVQEPTLTRDLSFMSIGSILNPQEEPEQTSPSNSSAPLRRDMSISHMLNSPPPFNKDEPPVSPVSNPPLPTLYCSTSSDLNSSLLNSPPNWWRKRKQSFSSMLNPSPLNDSSAESTRRDTWPSPTLNSPKPQSGAVQQPNQMLANDTSPRTPRLSQKRNSSSPLPNDGFTLPQMHAKARHSYVSNIVSERAPDMTDSSDHANEEKQIGVSRTIHNLETCNVQ